MGTLVDDFMQGRAGALAAQGGGDTGDAKAKAWLHNSPVIGHMVWTLTPLTLHEVNQFGIADVNTWLSGITKEVNFGPLGPRKWDGALKALQNTGSGKQTAGIGPARNVSETPTSSPLGRTSSESSRASLG